MDKAQADARDYLERGPWRLPQDGRPGGAFYERWTLLNTLRSAGVSLLSREVDEFDDLTQDHTAACQIAYNGPSRHVLPRRSLPRSIMTNTTTHEPG